MDGTFKRGNKANKKKIVDIAKPTPAPKETKDTAVESHPVEVEKILHLQRQAKNNGGFKEEKLKAEQAERQNYNTAISTVEDTSLYSAVNPPAGSSIIKLFKKPIFELNGFLKPDLVKRTNEKTGSVYYVENRFPYLECGVVVNENGLNKQFGEADYKGAIVTLKVNTRLEKYVYFIDKTDITPTYYEGYICIPNYELESVLATKDSAHFNAMVEKCTGITGNAQLQTQIEEEK